MTLLSYCESIVGDKCRFISIHCGQLKTNDRCVSVESVNRKQSPAVVSPSHFRGTNDEPEVLEGEFSSTTSTTVHELCQWEVFRAECPTLNEVLLITGAVYGRYRLGGRCIRTPYGRMSCGRLALGSVGSRCSARRRCAFPVTSLHSELLQPPTSLSSSSSSSSSAGTCPMELTAHLLVKYRCLKGEKSH